jgi:hypothetical protein
LISTPLVEELEEPVFTTTPTSLSHEEHYDADGF